MAWLVESNVVRSNSSVKPPGASYGNSISDKRDRYHAIGRVIAVYERVEERFVKR